MFTTPPLPEKYDSVRSNISNGRSHVWRLSCSPDLLPCRARARPVLSSAAGRSRVRGSGRLVKRAQHNGDLAGLTQWNRRAMFPTTTPTQRKSASLQVVFSVLSCGPSNGNNNAGRILMMTPLANPPMTAPLRPPVALPKMAAVAPVKKCGTRFGMMTTGTRSSSPSALLGT